MIKQGAIIVFMNLFIVFSAHADEVALNIDSCFKMAVRNYPLVKQYAIIEQSRDYSIENANKGYLPQLGIVGQATYQSEVTKLPISLPNISVPEMNKDQYRLYGEVTQPITELFTLKDQKELVKANNKIETQKIEVELYKLRERINQLYFGVLLMDAQIAQIALLKKDIQSGIEKANIGVANGIMLKSSVDNLKVELLKVEQRKIELSSNRKGFVDMLSLFIGQSISSETVFSSPQLAQMSETVNRSELRLFDSQKSTIDIQNKLITNKNLPRFNLFFQGGIGRPALNMLSNDVKGYYITGLRLNWSLSGFYTFNKERKILDLNKTLIDIQKEAFLFNTNVSMKQQNSEIVKYIDLLATDVEIIQLREQIKNTTKNQLENGTATTNDYLTNLNAADQARQTKLYHQIQLQMAQYSYQTTTGN
jgi:outer membrane protein TolC